jgi:hypothetical protein
VETLEQEILNTEQVIARLPAAQVRGLEKSLRNLSALQRSYISATLQRLREDGALPPRHMQFLEYFFEKWSGHSLPTKLVLISRITRFASRYLDQDPPDDDLPLNLFGLPEILRQAS